MFQGERSRTGDASPSSRLYLGQMSDLLARYVDLELVASKREAKAAHAEISARLVSCLSVYLGKFVQALRLPFPAPLHRALPAVRRSFEGAFRAVLCELSPRTRAAAATAAAL